VIAELEEAMKLTEHPDSHSRPGATERAAKPSRRWQLIAGCSAALAAIAAAIPAIAATTATPKSASFFACVINKSGDLHLVSSTAKCAAGEHKISWNSTGPAGPKGPQGGPGAQGLPGVSTGYIDSNNGAALSSSSSTTVAALKLPAGKYLVIARVEPGFTSTSSNPDLVDCSVEIAGSQSAIATGAATLIPGVGQTSGESVSLIGATSIAGKGGGKIVMTCSDHDSQATAAFPVITAIPVHSLVSQTG
jgi:hypothetical protein